MHPIPLAVALGGQTAPADTIVMVAARDGVDLVFAVAAGAIALTFFALLTAIVLTLKEMARAQRKLERLGEKVARDPGIESLRRVSANLESVSASVRDEAERLTASVGKLSERLAQASDRMEERIEEFNALMEVVQAEAEGAFVDTAATARGVRKGLGEAGRAARKGGREGRDRDRDPQTVDSSSPSSPDALPALEDPEEVEAP